jgi:hypothetical protein
MQAVLITNASIPHAASPWIVASSVLSPLETK